MKETICSLVRRSLTFLRALLHYSTESTGRGANELLPSCAGHVREHLYGAQGNVRGTGVYKAHGTLWNQTVLAGKKRANHQRGRSGDTVWISRPLCLSRSWSQGRQLA